MTCVKSITITCMAAGLFSGCVSMPDFDATQGTPPELQAEIDAIKGFPKTSSTPQTPTDLPTPEQFDRSALYLLSLTDAFDNSDVLTEASPQEIEATRQRFLNRVNGYTLDDPS